MLTIPPAQLAEMRYSKRPCFAESGNGSVTSTSRTSSPSLTPKPSRTPHSAARGSHRDASRRQGPISQPSTTGASPRAVRDPTLAEPSTRFVNRILALTQEAISAVQPDAADQELSDAQSDVVMMLIAGAFTRFAARGPHPRAGGPPRTNAARRSCWRSCCVPRLTLPSAWRLISERPQPSVARSRRSSPSRAPNPCGTHGSQ